MSANVDTTSSSELRAALDRVRADIQEIDGDLNAVETERSRLIEKRQKALGAAEYLEALLGSTATEKAESDVKLGKPLRMKSLTEKADARFKKPSGRKQVVDFAREIMPQQGRPLEPQELHALIIERGLELNTKHPDHTVRRTLSELKDIFVHVEGKGYWLADVKLPDAP